MAHAGNLAEPNLFNGTTVAVSSTFGSSAFQASNLVDGSNRAHVFGDGQPTASVSISGFNSSIGTLRFFDTPSYDARVSPTVAIYRSSSVTNSLDPSSYSFVGTFTLPTRNIPFVSGASATHDGYTIATVPVDFPRAGDPAVDTSRVINFAELTGLPIPSGTRSVLLNFTEVHPDFGAGLTEIQAFASVPEPALAITSTATFSNDYSAASYQIPFQNIGLHPLVISSVSVSGADAASFTAGTFTSPVAAGMDGTLNFNFTPTNGPGTYQATFSIHSNDPVTPMKAVAVSVGASAIQLGKVLCIGDSITEASAPRTSGDGNWSWRYPFWKRCVDANVGLTFVGTRTANNSGSSTYPAYLSQSFSNRHEAIWGTTANERNSSSASYLGTLATSNNRADVAVIFCGGNDLAPNLSGSPTTVRDHIKSIVDRLQGDVGTSGTSAVRVLLVGILPRYINGPAFTTPDPRNTTHFSQLNGLLQTLAGTETTATSKVTYVDISAPFTSNSALLYDGVHPGGAGEQIIGDAIFGILVPDSDLDGLPDSWERNYYPTLLSANSNSDTDQDDIISVNEFVFGSSPIAANQPSSVQLDLSVDQLRFTLPVAAGLGYEGRIRRYTVQSSDTLEGWSNVATGSATGEEIIVPINQEEPRMFFRLNVRLD